MEYPFLTEDLLRLSYGEDMNEDFVEALMDLLSDNGVYPILQNDTWSL